jgi:lysophospholipase L1-like esterase
MRRRPWRIGTAVLVVGSLLAACGDDDDTVPIAAARYVALGDSFSAGVGAPPYDETSGECERSEQAWPYVLDEDDGEIRLVEVRACGGAKTEHLLAPWGSRDEPAQIPTEPDSEVGLVTLTIGGNDAGFGDIVATCVLGSCAGTPTSPAFIATLDALQVTLEDDVYPALRTAYPEARIVHVGYPRLTPASGDLPLECIWLSGAEQGAAVAIVDQLNDAIAEAAAASDDDIEYADVARVLEGHELCTDDSWVKSISLDSDRAHPTAEGYVAIATGVADALDA